MPHNAKGSRRERELLELLVPQGFVVHRVAGSGKNENAICDLIAISRTGKVWFIEVKSRKSVYYPKDDIEQLKSIIVTAKRCRARPVLAVKLNYKDWQFFDLRRGIPNRVT